MASSIVDDGDAGGAGPAVAPSRLRLARAELNATLEQVCQMLGQRSSSGSSGVTPSMLSAWERNKRSTSVRYRRVLADFYQVPARELFAFQDATPHVEVTTLLTDHDALRAAMLNVVAEARVHLAVVGSRSRDRRYLDAIESALREQPRLIHHRILIGPPRHQVLHEHLLRLVRIRNPADRDMGIKTLHLGVVDDDPSTPERFFCASENAAVVPIPSLTSADAFDSGVLLAPIAAGRLVDHARQIYAAARRVETEYALRALTVAAQ